MSEIKVNNQNIQNAQQVQPAVVTTPATTQSVVAPSIVNNNGYIPTYVPSYYTNNFGYQYPYPCYPYPCMPMPPQATVQAGGTTYQVPQGTSGVNIIVNNPTVATPGSQPMINTNTNCFPANGQGQAENSGAQATATSTATSTVQKPTKTKNIVALTDDYIKNLENYLRSPNKELKQYAVQELSKRFAEDESRKTNKSLNALLNLALQAKESNVRFVALSMLISGTAGGNEKTVELLNNMQQSKAYNGYESSDAKKALLKMSETVVKIPDNSTDTKKSSSKGDNQ